MIKAYLILIIVVAGLLTCSGCKDSITGEDVDNRDIPDKDVSYIRHIQPVLEVKCNNAGCHNDESKAGNLSLTSYQSTTSDLSIVFPGEPQNSRLATVIQPGSGFTMPPLSYPPLTEDQINGIITWIKEGAKNN